MRAHLTHRGSQYHLAHCPQLQVGNRGKEMETELSKLALQDRNERSRQR